MPFREKSAWISFVTVLGVFGAYFGALLTGRLAPNGATTVHYLLISVVAVVVLQAALHLAAWLMARADAGSPKDERERWIELKAIRVAYFVLIVAVPAGVFIVLHTRLLGGPPVGSKLALVVLGSVILADVVKSATTIVQYRLDA
jgi:hypothetical protein